MGIKFDGTKVKDGSTTVGTMRGDKLCKGTGHTALGTVRGDKLCTGTGHTALGTVRGDKLCTGTGHTKLITMKDAAKAIGATSQGPATALVWWFFAK